MTMLAIMAFKLKFLSLNCHGLKANSLYIESLTNSYAAIFLSEHWLSNMELFLFEYISSSHHVIFHAAQKHTSGGRPFGGNCFLQNKNVFQSFDILLRRQPYLCN